MGEGQAPDDGGAGEERGSGEQAETQEGLHTRQTPNALLSLCLLGPGNPHKGIGGQEQNRSQVTGGGTRQKSLQGNKNERDSSSGR